VLLPHTFRLFFSFLSLSSLSSVERAAGTDAARQANLATGAVNKAVDTLATPDAAALLLLAAYLAGLSALALWLQRRDINLKFW
jgi:hypothetical protein